MNQLAIVGLVLWWAEGSKSRRDTRWKNAVSYPVEITNTDPRIIKLFIDFIVNELEVDINKFKLQLQVHEGDNVEELKMFWSKASGIKIDNFQKVIIRPVGNKPSKTKGTCKVRFSDKIVYNILQQKLDNLLNEFSGIGAVG